MFEKGIGSSTKNFSGPIPFILFYTLTISFVQFFEQLSACILFCILLTKYLTIHRNKNNGVALGGFEISLPSTRNLSLTYLIQIISKNHNNVEAVRLTSTSFCAHKDKLSLMHPHYIKIDLECTVPFTEDQGRINLLLQDSRFSSQNYLIPVRFNEHHISYKETLLLLSFPLHLKYESRRIQF